MLPCLCDCAQLGNYWVTQLDMKSLFTQPCYHYPTLIKAVRHGILINPRTL